MLARLQDCSEDDPRISQIEHDMETALRLEQESNKFSLRDLFNDKTPVKNTRRLVLCFLIQFWQQFTGINVIAFYVTIVLEVNVGLSRETSSLVAGCIQIAFWLGTFPPMWLLDKVGRRPMLLLGSVALLVSMVMFTAGIAVNTPATANMALAMLFVYEISFGMSWNSIPWLYAAEITPLELRHIGSAVATFSEWLWTFVSSITLPNMDLTLTITFSPKGHSPDHTLRYQHGGLEVLPSFLHHDSLEHSIHLFLLSRGKFFLD